MEPRPHETPLYRLRVLLGGGTPLPVYLLAAACSPPLHPNTVARAERSPLDVKTSTTDNLCRTLRRLGVSGACLDMLAGRIAPPDKLDDVREQPW
jgi:hypothetical protein